MTVSNAQISEVRAFNRDYTRRIGVLSGGLLESPYSLTEVRVMYEIAHRPGITAAELGAELGLDRGYLRDRKSTRLNSSHVEISYAVFCLKKKHKAQRQLTCFRDAVS